MFIDMLQRVLDTLGINVQFQLPYRFKTKGEMMRECLDQDLLQNGLLILQVVAVLELIIVSTVDAVFHA